MARRPEEVCGEALATGVELLRLMADAPDPGAAPGSGPSGAPGAPDGAEEELIARREALLNELQAILEDSVPPDPVRSLLGELMAQQASLEAAVRRRIDLLGKAMRGQQAARADLESFRRVINPGTRSRLLDQKR